jgi:hypothetical protein
MPDKPEAEDLDHGTAETEPRSDREEILQSVIVTLARITDVRQRSYALCERLREEQAQVVVETVRTIRERALQGRRDYVELYNSVVAAETWLEVFGASGVSELIEAARSRGEYQLVALFLDLPVETSRDSPFQPFLDPGLKETPLGIRKALARRPDFQLLRRIGRDQDHRVIRVLLSNSRMTETDVIRIGSTRPTSPKVLDEISRHPLWVARYSVKKVIVFNPHSPLSLALRFVTFMKLQDLLDLVEQPGINPVLAEQARRIIEAKTEGRSLSEEPA